jgi:hypothetical protein
MVDITNFGIDWSSMPEKKREPVPEGIYTAYIDSSDRKKTKNGDSEYIELVWKITDEAYKNRLIWDLIYMGPKSREISDNKLKTLCRSMGLESAKNTEELHLREIKIAVKIEVSDQFGAQNRITNYKEKDVDEVAF